MVNMPFKDQEKIGFRYVLDLLECASPYGRALIRRPRFYAPHERDALEREFRNIIKIKTLLKDKKEEFLRIEQQMAATKDIRKSVERGLMDTLSEVELFELKRFLIRSEFIAEAVAAINIDAQLEGINILPRSDALGIIDPDGQRMATFYLNDAMSPALQNIRERKRELEGRIHAATEGKRRDELLTLRGAIVAEEGAEEYRLRHELTLALRPRITAILECMDAIAAFDFTLARAKLAVRYGGVMPELTESRLSFTGMVNPRVADSLAEKGRVFMPITIAAERGATVITGANMGGKSVALKTLALNALLVSCAILPFAQMAELPLFDSIHIISEEGEKTDSGLSSFGAEIVAFNDMLRSKGDFSLLLLDEFARGTNPREGAAIVRAVVRYLSMQDAVSVLSTHYDDVAHHANAHYEVVGLKGMDIAAAQRELAISGDGVAVIAAHMNYGLYRVEGESEMPRDALNICRLLSLEGEIIEDVATSYPS